MKLAELEKNLISQIASDLESGNHLIRKRNDNYWAIFRYMINIINNVKQNIVISPIQQEYYNYFKTLSK